MLKKYLCNRRVLCRKKINILLLLLLNIIAHTLWGVVQEADRDESMFLSALA